MELTQVYIQLGILLMLMLIGYGLGKIKWMDETSNTIFSKYIVKIALPAIIISGMNMPLNEETITRAISIFGLSILIYAIVFIVAWFVPKILEKNQTREGILSFMILFSNCGFMGFPVIGAFLGEESIFYVAIYNIVFNVLLYTVGIKFVRKGKDDDKGLDLKLLINPGTVASAIGIMIFLTGIPIPEFIMGSIKSIGSTCTPLSMVVIGSMLSLLPIKKMFSDKNIYIVTFIRLFLLPFIIYTLLKYILKIEDSWLIAIPVMIAGMPVASNAAMMAEAYDSDGELASQGILITTLFSCISIPILIYFL